MRVAVEVYGHVLSIASDDGSSLTTVAEDRALPARRCTVMQGVLFVPTAAAATFPTRGAEIPDCDGGAFQAWSVKPGDVREI